MTVTFYSSQGYFYILCVQQQNQSNGWTFLLPGAIHGLTQFLIAAHNTFEVVLRATRKKKTNHKLQKKLLNVELQELQPMFNAASKINRHWFSLSISGPCLWTSCPSKVLTPLLYSKKWIQSPQGPVWNLCWGWRIHCDCKLELEQDTGGEMVVKTDGITQGRQVPAFQLLQCL